jgi:hypothetical protein
MKTVKMQGGIGNQLFCLAFADSVARLGHDPVAIDLEAFRSDRYGHAFDLQDLALALGFRLVRHGLMGSRPATALMRAAPLARIAPLIGYVSEGAPPTDEAALAAFVGSGRYFNGYWQNQAYIAHPAEFAAQVRAVVRRRATPATPRDVVIHYRTYKEEIRPSARRTPGPSYVRAALGRIEATLGRSAEVCLVSDDPALALRTLGDLGREVTVAASPDAWSDMGLLMAARALVLTNSSFSWWGGFCGDAALAIYPAADGYFHYPIPSARFVCV